MTRQRPSFVTVQVVESHGHDLYQITVDLADPLPYTGPLMHLDATLIAAKSRARDTARRALRRHMIARGYIADGFPVGVRRDHAESNAADAVYRFVFTEKE